MKKGLFTLLTIAIIGALAACGGSGDSEGASDDKTEIKFGATAGPFSDMIQSAIKPELEEKGYEVEVVEFSDYIQPNNALNSEDLDANLFQHIIYLENFNEENGMDLADTISVPTAPLGLYSDKYDSIDDIEDGATVSVPNDPTNAARAFMTLEESGLIEVDPDAEAIKVSENDITENPKNLDIQPLEAGQLPRSVDSVDIAAVPGNFAVAADFDLLDAIALEEMPEDFRNVVAVRAEDESAQFTEDIIEVIESDAFEEVIDEEFEGFSKPEWMEEK